MLRLKNTRWVISYRREVAYWLIALVILGYPLSALMVSMADIDSREITVPFRILVFSLATSLLILSKARQLVSQIDWRIILFLLLYLARVSYDLLFANNLFALTALDVEGLDYDILNSIDFTLYRPTIICVEFNNNLDNNNIIKLLERNGYDCARIIGCNIMARNTIPDYLGVERK